MTDVTDDTVEDPPKKRSLLPMLIGLVLGIALAGAGYFAVHSGLILAPGEAESEPVEEGPDITFLPVDPLVVSLGGAAGGRHLRFQAQLEVPGASVREVTERMPRITDVLNGYLRAVDVALLTEPAALVQLRAQMLRRVRMVVGDDNVRDLLVMEFVLN
ncbi:MAG: flagellar basal body-associated FliL family protein [Pseudomonadota bacterium]